MKKCYRCNKSFSDNYAFCPLCGSKLNIDREHEVKKERKRKEAEAKKKEEAETKRKSEESSREISKRYDAIYSTLEAIRELNCPCFYTRDRYSGQEHYTLEELEKKARIYNGQLDANLLKEMKDELNKLATELKNTISSLDEQTKKIHSICYNGKGIREWWEDLKDIETFISLAKAFIDGKEFMDDHHPIKERDSGGVDRYNTIRFVYGFAPSLSYKISDINSCNKESGKKFIFLYNDLCYFINNAKQLIHDNEGATKVISYQHACNSGIWGLNHFVVKPESIHTAKITKKVKYWFE